MKFSRRCPGRSNDPRTPIAACRSEPMKRLLATSLALCLAATTGLASAQTYNGSGNDYQQSGVRYDYARVLRVDPVFDSTYASNYPASGQRCYERRQYAGGGYADPYNNGGYSNNGYNNN